MLARVLSYCNSASCFNHRLFQCQQHRVLQHPLLLSDLMHRFEQLQQRASRIHPVAEVGSEVTVRQLLPHGRAGHALTFQLVEPSRANPARGQVSYLSPSGVGTACIAARRRIFGRFRGQRKSLAFNSTQP